MVPAGEKLDKFHIQSEIFLNKEASDLLNLMKRLSIDAENF